MIPTCAIHWHGLVQAISRYRFRHSKIRKSPGRRLDWQDQKHDTDMRDSLARAGPGNLKISFPALQNQEITRVTPRLTGSEHDTEMRDSLAGAGPGNLKISFQEANHKGTLKRTWWQLVPSHGRSSTKVVLPKKGNPTGRRPRPFQY